MHVYKYTYTVIRRYMHLPAFVGFTSVLSGSGNLQVPYILNPSKDVARCRRELLNGSI